MIHTLADCKAKVPESTCVWQFCVIFPEAKIGERCNICANSLIENDVEIGNDVTIKSGVQLWDGVRIEDCVFIGPNVTFTNDNIPRSKNPNYHANGITIKKGASVGANATLIAGITIGEYAFIGAGSVVTKDVPEYTVWYGNPAKQRGIITKNGIITYKD